MNEQSDKNTVPASMAEDFPVGQCGMVAVVGRANVGKSTLLNQCLDEKVSIVSSVVQTTRRVVRGILTEPRGQLVFLDTPGVHKPLSDLGKKMNTMAFESVEGTDAILLVLDTSEPPREEDERWMRRLLKAEPQVVIALNKCDVGAPHAEEYRRCWEQIEEDKGKKGSPCWVEISALKGDGVAELLDLLFELMPRGPQLFPADVLTDFPKNWTISDIIREKYFRLLRHELPHALAVGVDELEEGPDGSWDIRAIVYVDRPSQKGIILGHKGRMLRKVQRQAEAELCKVYDRPVKLKLWIKVEKHWARNFWLLKKLGYE